MSTLPREHVLLIGNMIGHLNDQDLKAQLRKEERKLYIFEDYVSCLDIMPKDHEIIIFETSFHNDKHINCCMFLIAVVEGWIDATDILEQVLDRKNEGLNAQLSYINCMFDDSLHKTLSKKESSYDNYPKKYDFNISDIFITLRDRNPGIL